MLTPTEAARLMLEPCVPLPSERRGLREALELVLAEDVHSPLDLPPWDNSAMEDTRCARRTSPGRAPERRATLRIVETVPAGQFPKRPSRRGSNAHLHGRANPGGADCVIRQEDTEALPDGGLLCSTAATPDTTSGIEETTSGRETAC